MSRPPARGATALFALAMGCSRAQPSAEAHGESPAPSRSTAGAPEFLPPIDTITASPPRSATDDGVTAGSPMATMKLLDAGRTPRRKLRYSWRLDQKEELTIDLRTAASTEVGGAKQPDVPLPPIRIAVAIDPREGTADGDLDYAWHVTSAAVTVDPDAPTSVAEGMRTEVAAIEKLSGTATVTSRGLTRRISISPESVVDSGATGQMVEQVRQTLRNVAAPFPDEAVGRGARWQKLSQLAAKDTRITQTETFSLVDLAADHGALDGVLAQTAPPQPLFAPGQPPGGEARLESALTSGGTKTRFDLSRLVPQSTFDGTATMVVSGPSPAESSRRMTIVMRLGVVLSGAVP